MVDLSDKSKFIIPKNCEKIKFPLAYHPYLPNLHHCQLYNLKPNFSYSTIRTQDFKPFLVHEIKVKNFDRRVWRLQTATIRGHPIICAIVECVSPFFNNTSIVHL